MVLATTQAFATTAISLYYGEGSISQVHTCSDYQYSHTVGVKRTEGLIVSSGYSWVSYSAKPSARVDTVVTVGNRVTSAGGTGYAQTSTINDLRPAPVSEKHY